MVEPTARRDVRTFDGEVDIPTQRQILAGQPRVQDEEAVCRLSIRCADSQQAEVV
jgi:hypothetical protein